MTLKKKTPQEKEKVFDEVDHVFDTTQEIFTFGTSNKSKQDMDQFIKEELGKLYPEKLISHLKLPSLQMIPEETKKWILMEKDFLEEKIEKNNQLEQITPHDEKMTPPESFSKTSQKVGNCAFTSSPIQIPEIKKEKTFPFLDSLDHP